MPSRRATFRAPPSGAQSGRTAIFPARSIESGDVPLLYELDEDLRPLTPGGRYLDPEAAAAAIEAVKNQGKSKYKRQVNMAPELLIRSSCGSYLK